jgi:hypothetical protein
MGTRLNRTLLNWRWWIILPIAIATLPLILLDFVLSAFVTAGEEAYELQRWMRRKVHSVFRWARIRPAAP